MPIDTGGARGTQPSERISASSVALENVSKEYDSVVAVRDLTLEARAGEFMVLLGPSGCGKTTVLRLVAGLEAPSSGAVRIGEQVVNDVDPKDRDVAMVFQSYALYPHLTVARNIEFPLHSRQVPASERRRLVEDVAKNLRLDGLLDRKPAQLSGGQRQRVALARAIVRRPQVFLMDEPLSNLDARLRVEMRAELVELHTRLGITILYVTHDQVEAMTMGERVAIIDKGVLQQVDTPSVVHDDPANAFVAGFIGSPPMNILRGEVVVRDGGHYVVLAGGRIEVPAKLANAVGRRQLSELVVGLRPEDLRFTSAGTLDAVVSLIEVVGRERHVGCRLPGGQLVWVRTTGGSPSLHTGERISLEARGPLYLFDPVTAARIDD